MRKVMIIDDNQTNLKMMDLILSKAGFKTDCIVKSEFAFELIKEVKPNLILLDVNMPDVNGFQLCKMIKKDKNIKDIPIIFVSALSDVKYIAGGLALGAVDYITKPIKAEELIARVSVQMELAKSKQKLLKATEKLQQDLLENFDIESDFVYSLVQIKSGQGSKKDYLRIEEFLKSVIKKAIENSQYSDIDYDFAFEAIKRTILK